MKKIMMIACMLIIAFISATAETVIVKDGDKITSFETRTYNDVGYGIDTYSYTGTSVNTLYNNDIPEQAWPLFARNEYLIFSVDAYKRGAEIASLREELSYKQDELDSMKYSRDLHMTLLWFAIAVIVIGIAVAWSHIVSLKERIKNQQAPQQVS